MSNVLTFVKQESYISITSVHIHYLPISVNTRKPKGRVCFLSQCNGILFLFSIFLTVWNNNNSTRPTTFSTVKSYALDISQVYQFFLEDTYIMILSSDRSLCDHRSQRERDVKTPSLIVEVHGGLALQMSAT